MLKYNGSGEHITGVPAHDLSDEEITRLAGDFNLDEDTLVAQLTSRGLYSVQKPKQSKKKTEEVDDGLWTEGISQDTDQ